MKSLNILLALLICGGCASTKRPMMTTLPFTPSDQTIELSQLEEVDGVSLLKGEPYTGLITAYHDNGALKLRRGSLNGRAHGAWQEWHENGNLSFYSEWTEGLGDGPFLYLWDNGRIRERATAERDIWNGISEGWQRNGAKSFEAVYEDGNLIEKREFNESEAIKP